MKLPPLVYLLGYAGLIPFLAGPLWLTLAPATAPAALDRWWLAWAALIAAFMAGSFWGMALQVVEGPSGQLGMAMSGALMVLAWAASLLPLRWALPALGVVFLLLVLAEFWRQRVLDPLSGYLSLRATLTLGVLAAFVWRWLLGGLG
ncbi:MAG: DUF3429 domain-containing protein [Nevskia sp.]|nr:DUF3429 domain-containing protein [Nevskia sp.]